MFNLTFRERKILLAIGVLIAAGSLMKYLGLAEFPEPTPKVSFKKASLKKSDSRLIDINRASSKELEEISGIGKVIAERIVKYRFKYGSFRNIKDLEKVKGIGPKKAGGINKQVVFK